MNLTAPLATEVSEKYMGVVLGAHVEELVRSGLEAIAATEVLARPEVEKPGAAGGVAVGVLHYLFRITRPYKHTRLPLTAITVKKIN